ncbi:hypothetical protein EJ08DRAFT_380439 [Tothia fuscella]|uniref:Glutamyl-tRNA(Gln) amidotransferase subunit B, mitochondrial n=1 Tax=Tothia fuscella TaxID=1048955 RepID=A0A9P4NL66_9PEZI|nr:hypothetical protein EJ08DRAFT_380439 [Tothia fuscella]
MLRTRLTLCAHRLTRGIQTSVNPRLKNWELTVGIEIHAELNTARKLFSSALTSYNAEPNSNVAPFDLAYPGSQPHFQKATLLPALRAAIALNCNIQRKSSFDRKHYFYQDQPAGYQITQYYEPFAKDGEITLFKHDGIAEADGEAVTIGVKQVQMEQDTAKTLQNPPSGFLLDFNRVSHPLIEIITLPQIHHPATGAALVRKVQAILKSVNACTAGMETGGLRADVNVSVKRRDADDSADSGHSYAGVTGLGQRTEIKNLSSFKAVEDAIIAERDRQIEVLEEGGTIDGETRGWSLGSTETIRLRGKEGEVDYRYMPDPDIPPVVLSNEVMEHLKQTLPMLPDEILAMLTTEHGLTLKDAKTLLAADDGDRIDFYLEVLEQVRARLGGKTSHGLGALVGNWIIHEVGGVFSKAGEDWSEDLLPPSTLAHIISLALQGSITNNSAKKLLWLVYEDPSRDVQATVEEENMTIQDIADGVYASLAQELVTANPDMVRAIREKGQKGKVMWFVGQMMRELSKRDGGGGANPEKCKNAVSVALEKPVEVV